MIRNVRLEDIKELAPIYKDLYQFNHAISAC